MSARDEVYDQVHAMLQALSNDKVISTNTADDGDLANDLTERISEEELKRLSEEWS